MRDKVGLYKDLRDEWRKCRRCPLGERTNTRVLWDIPESSLMMGMTRLDILFVGEGPGESEDGIGQPFVGVTGQLVRAALKEAGVTAFCYGFTNLVACRPQDKVGGMNRPPAEPEIEACTGRLEGLITLFHPRYLVALGRVPERRLQLIHHRLADPKPVLHWNHHPSYIYRSGGRIGNTLYYSYVEQLRFTLDLIRKHLRETTHASLPEKLGRASEQRLTVRKSRDPKRG